MSELRLMDHEPISQLISTSV